MASTDSCIFQKVRHNAVMTVDQIVKYFGTKTKAANGLGVHLQTLRDWRRGGIPVKTEAWIQLKTGGALKATKR